jgi:hypothetical protein
LAWLAGPSHGQATLAIPRIALSAVALPASAPHVVPIVVTAFTQWYRVMVNRCSPRIIEVSAIVALATADMALKSVAEQDVLSSAFRVVKPTVLPASLAIITDAFF